MPSELQNLQTARSNIAANIATITAKPKPTYMVDGQMFSWGDYHKQLMDAYRDLGELIQQVQPSEVLSHGVSE